MLSRIEAFETPPLPRLVSVDRGGGGGASDRAAVVVRGTTPSPAAVTNIVVVLLLSDDGDANSAEALRPIDATRVSPLANASLSLRLLLPLLCPLWFVEGCMAVRW